MRSKVIWLDRGWQPLFIGFCPDEAAWRREVKRLGCPDTAYPTSDGCVTYFEGGEDHGACCIVTLNRSEGRDDVVVAGLLVHEAVHVWQHVKAKMGESEPSWEFEAYSVQAIFQQLYQAHHGRCAALSTEPKS